MKTASLDFNSQPVAAEAETVPALKPSAIANANQTAQQLQANAPDDFDDAGWEAAWANWKAGTGHDA